LVVIGSLLYFLPEVLKVLPVDLVGNSIFFNFQQGLFYQPKVYCVLLRSTNRHSRVAHLKEQVLSIQPLFEAAHLDVVIDHSEKERQLQLEKVQAFGRGVLSLEVAGKVLLKQNAQENPALELFPVRLVEHTNASLTEQRDWLEAFRVQFELLGQAPKPLSAISLRNLAEIARVLAAVYQADTLAASSELYRVKVKHEFAGQRLNLLSSRVIDVPQPIIEVPVKFGPLVKHPLPTETEELPQLARLLSLFKAPLLSALLFVVSRL
jgi:hypothetical protein